MLTYAKMQQASSITIMPKIFSIEVNGTMSPYPTVLEKWGYPTPYVIVVVAQYTDAIYLVSHGLSTRCCAVSQLSIPAFSS